MTDEGNGKVPTFKVDFSSQVAKEIKQILDNARTLGIEEVVKGALATIFRRLRRDPLGFGELVKEYTHLKLLDHVGIIKPLVVRFGINLDARIVIISKLRLLSPGGVE